MDIVITSIVILIASGGVASGVLWYINHNYDRFLQQRLLQQKQMEIYEHIAILVGRVKESINFVTGDETVRQWKKEVARYLNDLRCNSFTWSVFLPESTQELTEEYANAVGEVLRKFESLAPDDVHTVAQIIDEIKQVEREAAIRLRGAIRKELI